MKIYVENELGERFWLAGEDSSPVTEFTLDSEENFQKIELIHAKYAQEVSRGNLYHRISFSTYYSFETYGTPEEFLLRENERVPRSGTVHFITTEDEKHYILSSACIYPAKCETPIGILMKVTYTVGGGRICTPEELAEEWCVMYDPFPGKRYTAPAVSMIGKNDGESFDVILPSGRYAIDFEKGIEVSLDLECDGDVKRLSLEGDGISGCYRVFELYRNDVRVSLFSSNAVRGLRIMKLNGNFDNVPEGNFVDSQDLQNAIEKIDKLEKMLSDSQTTLQAVHDAAVDLAHLRALVADLPTNVQLQAFLATFDAKMVELNVKYTDILAKHTDIVTKHTEVLSKVAIVNSNVTAVKDLSGRFLSDGNAGLKFKAANKFNQSMTVAGTGLVFVVFDVTLAATASNMRLWSACWLTAQSSTELASLYITNRDGVKLETAKVIPLGVRVCIGFLFCSGKTSIWLNGLELVNNATCNPYDFTEIWDNSMTLGDNVLHGLRVYTGSRVTAFNVPSEIKGTPVAADASRLTHAFVMRGLDTGTKIWKSDCSEMTLTPNNKTNCDYVAPGVVNRTEFDEERTLRRQTEQKLLAEVNKSVFSVSRLWLDGQTNLAAGYYAVDENT